MGGLEVGVRRLVLRHGVKAAVMIGVWVQSWRGSGCRGAGRKVKLRRTLGVGFLLRVYFLAAYREAEVDEDPDVIVTREVELAEAVVRENLAV